MENGQKNYYYDLMAILPVPAYFAMIEIKFRAGRQIMKPGKLVRIALCI